MMNRSYDLGNYVNALNWREERSWGGDLDTYVQDNLRDNQLLIPLPFEIRPVIRHKACHLYPMGFKLSQSLLTLANF